MPSGRWRKKKNNHLRWGSRSLSARRGFGCFIDLAQRQRFGAGDTWQRVLGERFEDCQYQLDKEAQKLKGDRSCSFSLSSHNRFLTTFERVSIWGYSWTSPDVEGGTPSEGEMFPISAYWFEQRVVHRVG